ncbi:MAG: 3-deoxy-manno-octulosonate cytidylyltransferase [Acidobacteriota bacterium]
MTKVQAIAVIPARFSSTRFPGKPLVKIGDKPMIQHVYERTRKAKGLADVIVATDDKRIVEAVEHFGGKACLTSRSHRSGTDRVAEVAQSLEAEVVVNVQGDEPLLEPSCIEAVIRPFESDPSLPISTLKCPGDSEEEFYNPNIVKVVTDRNGYALYFSRSPIPFLRYAQNTSESKRPLFFRHIGLYAYRKSFLEQLPKLKPSVLEKAEALEQLRFLENGFRIRVVQSDYRAVAVDTPDDVQQVVDFLASPRVQAHPSD